MHHLNYLQITVLTLLCLMQPLKSEAQCIYGDCQTGIGAIKFKSGSMYLGEFSHGKFNGTGILFSADGDRFLGKWLQDARNGYGKLMMKDGRYYEGEFNSNRFEGYGSFRYRDKSVYSGLWSNSYPNGPGRYKNAANEVIEGIWKDGTLTKMQPIASAMRGKSKKLRDCNTVNCNQGFGIYNYSDGSRWEGQFEDGKPYGIGACFYANGEIYMGEWTWDSPDGYGIMYYSDGRSYETFWEMGKASAPNKKPIVESEVPISSLKTFDKSVRIWSVIIGIGRYTSLPPLKYTDDDAYHLYAFLKSPEGGAVPDNQIQILIDESATRENILKTLKNTFSKADENDVVLLYFSGHGINGYYLPVDSDGYKNRISYDEIKKILEGSAAKHKLCIADACYSGSLLAQRSAFGESLDLFYATFEKTKGGTAFLLSSKQEELSLESSGIRQGIFSHYLIKGLKGASDKNKDMVITIRELYDYVYYNVKEYSGNAQTPVIAGNFDNNMPVAVIRF